MRRIPLPRPVEPQLARIFDILRAVAAERMHNAPLRIAGGWVRDMVMGRESHDVDIAIETPASYGELITGAKYATTVADYISVHPELSGAAGSISVIKTNPERSKHIETAQMKLFDIPLEFCHLRQDDYTQCGENRIPTVRPGTPLEDAQRRDFTCNALFFNLQDGFVEDYCDGLADLANGVLRCPLHPFETFFDDPLRVLRGVRFLGQLGFSFHASITDVFTVVPNVPIPDLPYPYSMNVGPLHPLCNALIVKVARERGAIELTKMLEGPDPIKCVWAMLEIGVLFPTILLEAYYSTKPKGKNVLPDVVLPMVIDESLRAEIAPEIVRGLRAVCHQNMAIESWGDDKVAVALCAMLAPVLRGSPSLSPTAPQVRDRVEGCVLKWLKLPSRVSDFVASVFAAVELLEPCNGEIQALTAEARPITGECRTQLYRALRALQYDQRLVPHKHALTCCLAMLQLGVNPELDPALVASRAAELTTVIERDTDGALLNSCITPPLIRGDQLSQYINVPRPQTGRVIEAEREYMLHNPGCTEADVIGWLRSQHPPAAGSS